MPSSMTHQGVTLVITLTALSGRVTAGEHRADADQWCVVEPDGHETDRAEIALFLDGEEQDRVTLTGDLWRHLQDEVDPLDIMRELKDHRSRAFRGVIEYCMRAHVDWMTNHYHHDADGCDAAWQDEHSCACDDECPNCGASITPHDSTVHVGIVNGGAVGDMLGIEFGETEREVPAERSQVPHA